MLEVAFFLAVWFSASATFSWLVAIASNKLPGHGRSGAAIGGHLAVLATAFLGIGEWSISSTQMAIAVTIGFGVMLVPVGFSLGFAVDNALMLLFRRGRT